MATEILRPNGNGDENTAGTVVGASTRWEAIDEAVADDDTSYVYEQGSSEAEYVSVNLDATALTTETVDSIDVWYRSREVTGGGGRVDAGVRLSGSNTMNGYVEVGNSYADREAAALARPGGGSWAVSDLGSLQGRFGQREDGGGNFCITTQLYIEVNYTAAGKALPPFPNRALRVWPARR